MTACDEWKTNKQEIDDEAWEEAVDHIGYAKHETEVIEIVDTLANADDVLTWLSHAVEVPQHHRHAFRDLIKLASSLRKEVETEMKANRSFPDAD